MSGSSSPTPSGESDSSSYYIQKIRPVIPPPRSYPPVYNPGFEVPDPNVYKVLYSYYVEYDPGFLLTIKSKPRRSKPVEISDDAERYPTPYDPGFVLPNVNIEVPESHITGYDQTAPSSYFITYDPGFTLPPVNKPPESYPSAYDPGFNLHHPPAPLTCTRPPHVIPPLASLSYSEGELRNCEPDCEPPPIGFNIPPRGDTLEINQSHRWVTASTSDCSKPGSLLVGHDQDGSPIYAGRAYHNGDVLPGKVIPSKNVCYVAYNGEEIVKEQFEVLCQNILTWVPASGGNAPPGAVQIGNTSDGEPLYLGRVHSDGAITPGKVHPSHGCCYYPFDGEERNSTDYEILIAM